MHKDFAEWYRIVAIEPDDAMMNKRWAGVEEWCELTANDIGSMLDVVRLFLGKLPSKTEIVEHFTEVFRKQDAAFPQRNSLEIQVLAGAVAVNCITADDDSSSYAMTVALAMESGWFSATRSAKKLGEIGEVARRFLQRQSLRKRRREYTSVDDLRGDQSMAETLETFTKALLGNWEQVRAAVTALFQGMQPAIGGLENAIIAMAQDLTRADEECNMLWWLEGGCSRDFRTPWGSLQKEGLPIIAAKELSDITEILPGPHLAQALLHRALSRVELETVSIAGAVNKAPIDWVKSCIDSRPMDRLSDLTPVWLALKQRKDANDDRAWQAFFKKTTGIDPAKQLKADDLAGQVYLEALFLKALDNMEE